MSSLSLWKPLRMAAAEPRMVTEVPKEVRSRTVSGDDQDRSAANSALSPAVFWKAMVALAMVLFIHAAIGMSLYGTDWLTAYWHAQYYCCSDGYC